MSAKFFALLTVIGANKLAKATALGTTLKITQMAVGDGGGTLPAPDTQQTKLVGEKRRAGLNTLFVDPKNDSQIIAEQVIPENEGGYWIREIGLFDDEGSLIAVGNCPETYKPQLQEGSGRTQTIRMILTVSHTESVELKVDPSVILATREFVNDAIETASKSILDTVKKEYATTEEVKKKFDNSNVVHEKGASKEKVISQKGVTDLFQPKGSYPTNTELSVELNKKIDKSNIYQQLGNDVNKVPSLDLVTKELGKKQTSGNYADKSSSLWQLFMSPVMSREVIGSTSQDESSKLQLLSYNNSSPSIRKTLNGKYVDYRFPENGGIIALNGDSYTTAQSDNKYADKTSKNKQLFLSGVGVVGDVSVTFRDNSVDLIVSNTVVLFKTKIGDNNYEIALPAKNGTLAMIGDSYTTSQSDSRYPLKNDIYSKSSSDDRYQQKGNYADKSSQNTQYFSGSIESTLSIASVIPNKAGVSLDATSGLPLIKARNTAEEGWYHLRLPVKTGTIALLNDIEDSNNIPVGSPIPWSLSTAPTGYLICQGQTFNKTTYPKLAIAYPSGRLPDLRGNVIRGLDAGRGIDLGRQILSEQMGNSLLSARGVNNSPEGGFELKLRFGSVGTNNQGQNEIYQQKEGANGNETRMRNIAFLYIVRAV